MSTHTELKRVVDGKAYNTATAALIHEKELSPNDTYGPGYEHCLQLYRTRLGKFFLVERNEPYWNAVSGESDLRDHLFPMNQDQATKWMEEHCNDKIESYIDVPEAGDPSTTLTLRMDKTLKILLNAAAIKEGISMNVWCVRVLAQAVAQDE
ncbi:hypothetical protein [Cupriavidus sp. L7L]|uniref:hypothetical protein n=1 Tax=Cupriavidus sp. L7L TaxID=2546443 RepID=UPI00105559F4|nr:hypothetical protein [Cupriavidus sp. L7L]TDF62061.1 hypothetical protein E1J61_31680 [Cupriavidus sp. L7L]